MSNPTIYFYQALVPPDPFIAHIDVDLDELSGMPPNEIWVSDTIVLLAFRSCDGFLS